MVQHGCSKVRPRRADCVEFLSVAELGRLIADARAVVSHAGVGSILLRLANGRRPVVVPRLRRFAETVDDHQLVVLTHERVHLLRLCVENWEAYWLREIRKNRVEKALLVLPGVRPLNDRHGWFRLTEIPEIPPGWRTYRG